MAIKDESETTWETIKPWYARPKVMLPLLFVGFILIFFATCLDVPSFLAGETDIWGRYRFVEAQRELDAKRTPIEQVHAQLFPAWVVASASGDAASEAAESAYRELQDAVEDEELGHIIDELRDLMLAGDLVAHAAEVGELSDQWNRRLDALSLPFYGDIHVTSAGDHAFVVGIFYRRLQNATLQVVSPDGKTSAVDSAFMQRFDSTNLVEAYLGQAQEGRDFAVLIVDRILDFVVHGIWPIIAAEPSGDLDEGDLDESELSERELDEVDRAFAEPVRAEIRAALGDATYEKLRKAAAHRQALREVVDAIHARKRCGSRFQIVSLPYFGFDPITLRQLDAQAGSQKIQSCPTITLDEARALRRHSRALQDSDASEATARLVAWISQPIAVHEVQHIVDQTWMGAQELEELPCPGCEGEPTPITRLELSAYLASFTHAESPATALFQACRGSVGSGAHTRAMMHIMRYLDHRCADGPIENIGFRAHQLHQTLFDYSPTISLPQDYPQKLDLLSF